ncbi:MAG: hypothetical protein LBN93_03855 [Candidatus Symbiothrix sp.]|jgi:hypothetical protein|nr:hypothetical protein [Candidatus Symbiothrix sp.]
MKTKLFLFASIVLAVFAFVACSDDNDSQDIYYITVGQSDVNFNSNYLLQAKIWNYVESTSNSQHYKQCTESQAKTWLNQVVTEIKKPAFIEGIPVLKTTFTLEVRQSTSDPDSEGKLVTSQSITLEN